MSGMTPDRMPMASRSSRLDKAHDTSCTSMAPEINKNALGPKCHLDAPQNTSRRGGHLGTGSDSVVDAGTSIKSGAKAPKVNWSALSVGYHPERK